MLIRLLRGQFPVEQHFKTKKKTDTRSVHFLVHQASESFHEIRGEIERWREILAVPYQEHLLSN